MSLKSTVIMLTYKSHIPKNEYRIWLGNQFPKNTLKIAIAHESGNKEIEYQHSHVVVHFGVSTTISNKRVTTGFDYLGNHPNVKHGKGKNAWKDMLKYISKEDDDIGFEVEKDFNDTLENIWNKKNTTEVLKMCSKPSDVIPYLEIWRHKLLAIEHKEYHEAIANLELNEYQVEWWNNLKDQNDREVLWIVDEDGGKGKNTFGKWLRVVHIAEKHVLRSKAVNFMYQGSEFVYINITRSQEEHISYNAIEDLKDGDMVSDKYMGRSVLYAPPKVIVFSNMYPDTSKMSYDRWNIIHYPKLIINEPNGVISRSEILASNYPTHS